MGELIRLESVQEKHCKVGYWVVVELLQFPEGNDILLVKMEQDVGCFMSELQTSLFYAIEFKSAFDARVYINKLEQKEYEDYLHVEYYIDGCFL